MRFILQADYVPEIKHRRHRIGFGNVRRPEETEDKSGQRLSLRFNKRPLPPYSAGADLASTAKMLGGFEMIRWFLASCPVVVLLTTLMRLKWKPRRAGLVAWLTALAIGGACFGGYPYLLMMASAKGVSLTLFVVLIIWTSSFMFQLVNQTGLLPEISQSMTALSSDSLMLGLLMAWCLSGVIQAVAGYGVPVAVCAPLMIAVGFPPLTAAAATLVGHAWSITFGSMGSSYYTLLLATKIPSDILGHWVGLTFIVPTILSGIAVAHIIEGWPGVRRGLGRIVAVGLAMGLVQWIVVRAGLAQVASLLGSLTGVGLIALLGSKSSAGEWHNHVAPAMPPSAGRTASMPTRSLKDAGGVDGAARLAGTPYLMLLTLTFVSQIPAIKTLFAPYKFGLNYPSLTTRQGYVVAAEKGFAAIGLFSHPAPIIGIAILFGLILFLRKGLLEPKDVRTAARNTVSQCIPTTLGVLTMVMMALVMNDTGMTRELAIGVSRLASGVFPVVSPFIGALGCFMTGSNTNANVLFGAFQMETARSLSLSTTLIAGSQTTGASLASSIAPSKVLLGSSTTGLSGREGELLRKCLPYCLWILLLVGCQTMLGVLSFPMVP